MTADEGGGADAAAGASAGIARTLEANADRLGARTALAGDAGALSWHDFDRRAASVAALLADAGLRPGARVGLYLQDSSEYLEIIAGALKAGMSPVGIPSRYSAGDLAAGLAACDAGAVFFHACYAARLWEIRDLAPSVGLWVQVDDGTELLVDFASDYDQSLRDTPPAPRAGRGAAEVFVLPRAPGTGAPAPLAPYLERALSAAAPADAGVTLVAGPLSHPEALAHGALAPLCRGGAVVTLRPPMVEPHRLWTEVCAHRATEVVVPASPPAGAAVDALAEAARLGDAYDLGRLRRVVAGESWGRAERAEFARYCDAEVAAVAAPAS